MALLQPIISSVEHHVTLERVGSQDVLFSRFVGIVLSSIN